MMHMYANDPTLKVGVSHVRPLLPELLDFMAQTAEWDDAPHAYLEHTTKLVLRRDPLGL